MDLHHYRSFDDQPEASEAAGLRELFQCAQELARALRADALEPVLAECVVAYVRRAAALGISRVRIRAALRLLVVEDETPEEEGSSDDGGAQRRAQMVETLALVLRCADAA